MKKIVLAALGVLLLVVLFFTVNPLNVSAVNATCTATPTRASVLDPVQVRCSGFTPNVQVWTYYTEPDGYAGGGSTAKADQNGVVAFTFGPMGNTQYGSAPIGNWSVTVEELAPGARVLHLGVVSFQLTGGKEGVSGASLSANPSKLYMGQSTQISGSGFLPGEVVSVWYEAPNGDCSGLSLHAFSGDVATAGGFSVSTFYSDIIKADGSGSVAFSFAPLLFKGDFRCIGTYRVVARGNTSHNGAEVWVTYNGRVVTETARLEATPDVVNAIGQQITFTGSGFAPNQVVNCWQTTPQGATNTIFDFGVTAPRTDSAGRFSFSIVTGSAPWGSESALGDAAMTCKTGSAVGIAHYRVNGMVVDP